MRTKQMTPYPIIGPKLSGRASDGMLRSISFNVSNSWGKFQAKFT